MGQSFQRSLFLCGITVSLALGCGGNGGPPVGAVTGVVTMNGQPVPRVNITFVPREKGSPSYGATNEQGAYRMMFNQTRAGAELGTHDVVIENPEPETDDSGRVILSSRIVRIPQKYRQPGLLSAKVQSGKNELNFVLDPPDRSE